MSRSLPVGTMLGEYRIEEQIGRGGMGVVYRATQVKLDRSVAIKVLAPELADDPSHRERFTREARHAAGLEHPNVVPVHATGEVPEEGIAYLVMRYVEGSDLRALIRREGRLEPTHAAAIIAQVAAALDAAHQRGLVHRDVKPANILVSSKRDSSAHSHEHVYLTDFGLTKALESGVMMTKTGMWVGTVDYIAPEQLKGGTVDGRADIYSLGCVLHETLTGEIPYPRDTEPAKMWAHMAEDPPSPRSVSSDISEELDAVVQKAAAKNPDDRYQTAGELAEAATAAAHVYESRKSGIIPPLPPEPAAPTLERAATLDTTPAAETTLRAPEAAEPAPAAETSIREPEPAPAPAAAETSLRPASEVAPAAPETTVRATSEAPSDTPAPPSPPPAPPAAPEAPPSPAPREPRGGRRTGVLVAGAVAILVAVVAVVVLAGGGGGDDEKTSVSAPIKVGNAPADAIVAGDSVWVANQGEATLTRIDTGTGKPAGAPVKVVDAPYRLAVGEGILWAISGSSAQASGVSTANPGGTAATVDLPADPYDVAVGEGALWIAANAAGPNDSGRLIALDPRDGARRSVLEIGSSLTDVATGHGAVWVLDADGGILRRLNSSGETQAEIQVGSGATDVGTDASAVWVAAAAQHRLLRIDPSSNSVTHRIALTNTGDVTLATGQGSVFWIDESAGRVTRVDAKSHKPAGAPVKIGATAGGAAVTKDTLWVTSPTAGTVVRVSF